MSEYSLEAYGDMVADGPRYRAFAEALRQSVRPGDVVVEIGCGAGTFALMAAALGARRVHAVEPADVVQLGRACATASGLAERVAFVQGLSQDLTLPERADVVVSDLRGVLPLHGAHLAAVVDARERLLRPGGTLIGRRDVVRAALIASPRLHDAVVGPWRDDPDLGIDRMAVRERAVNRWRAADIGPDDLASEPATLFELDYGALDGPDAAGTVRLVAERPGAVHGLAVWFDAELAAGVRLSNAPGAERLIYGQAFFPLPHAVEVAAGDAVEAEIGATLAAGHYEWRWRTAFPDAEGAARVRFTQSTMLGLTVAIETLHRRSSAAMPGATIDGRAAAAALALFDGQTALGDVAEALAERFPERFGSRQAALDFAADLAVRYGA